LSLAPGRRAVLADAPAIARIYNQGIEERIATFETRLRTAREIRSWFGGTHPIVVVECSGEVMAFAATGPYRNRACYAGIAEVSLYMAREFRGRGAGRLAMQAILEAAEKQGSGSWRRASFLRITPPAV
jgi:L-amino acid N-acyltransferase YncA